MPPAQSLCVCSHSWGRWKDILTHGRFKWQLAEHDMEVLCRALLVYCVRHYMGDDKIKSFIWDLITPAKDGHKQDLQNHSGERFTYIPSKQVAIHSYGRMEERGLAKWLVMLTTLKLIIKV